MAEFTKALKATDRHEGGYADVKGDKGGETYRGISRVNWPHWIGWAIIDEIKAATKRNLNAALAANLSLQENVDQFYRTNFWDRSRLDEMEPQDIANEVYDTGVNFGPGRVVRMLQEAVNLTRKDVELTVDGLIGQKTISAVNTHENKVFLFKMLNVLQGEAYIEAVRKDPTQEKFMLGWFTRVTFLPAA